MLNKRPRLALLVVALLCLASLVVANYLATFDTATPDTIIDPGSQPFRNEAEYESTFGADPLVILVSGDVRSLLGGSGLLELVNLEGTLVLPANRALGVQAIYGPTSIAAVAAETATGSLVARLQQAASDASQKAFNDAKAAGASDADAQTAASNAAKAAQNQLLADAIKQFPELAKIGIPSETNGAFVSAIFLDQSGKPKPRFAAVVPDPDHILLTSRLGPSTGEAAVNTILRSLRSALARNPIPGAGVVVSGAPVLEAAVGRAIRLSLLAGMLLGIVTIAVLLVVALRRRAGLRARLLPLAGGIATVLALSGLVTLIGRVAAASRSAIGLQQAFLQTLLATFTVALNPATLAAFPIALGLSVDYGVQFIVRYRQAATAGLTDPLEEARQGAGRAARRAAICTGVGLCALLVSNIPMVRQFGVVMILGAALAWVTARLFVVAAVRGWPGIGRFVPRETAPGANAANTDEEDVALFGLGPLRKDEPELVSTRTEGRAGDAPGRLVRLARYGRERWRPVLIPALAIAVIGWVALPFSSFETNPERLVSPDLQAFKDLGQVRRATGSGGELDFVLSGGDTTSEKALSWVKDLQVVVSRDGEGHIKPLASLAALFTDITGGQDVTQDRVKALLQVIPPYFTDALVSRDHHLARIAFGIDNLVPVAQQEKEIGQILSDLEPPPGYSYYPAGLTYLGVRGLESLQSTQVPLNLLGAGLVLVALFFIYRRRRLALIAWMPTALVAGWSSAVLFLLRVPLTPMTAVLGALVVAFGTEFAILWLERYREAVARGITGAPAAEEASAAAGPGILVSGAALSLGFLALTVGSLPGVASLGFDLPMVRDFGLIAAMDIALAVGAALIVLPAIVQRFGVEG